jgi:hypothetical protein
VFVEHLDRHFAIETAGRAIVTANRGEIAAASARRAAAEQDFVIEAGLSPH